MSTTKKIRIVIISVMGVILSALIIYTAVHAFSGKTFEKFQNEMLTASVMENVSSDDIVVRRSIHSAPIGNDYLFASTDTKSEYSELFVFENKGWFGKEFLRRFKILNHSTTNDPVGSCILDIKNSDNKKSKVICIYSSNTLEIRRIDVEISNTETGDTQKIEFYTELLMPIASAQEIGNENYTVKSIKCYNEKDELVYSK